MNSYVLIVDDEPTVRKVLIEMLSDAEFKTIEAECTAQALKALRNAGAAISVLVTDVSMPGQLDGLDLAKLAQNSWPWIKVIVTTAFADRIAGRVPANARFVPKPWEPDEMLRCIRGASTEFQAIQDIGAIH